MTIVIFTVAAICVLASIPCSGLPFHEWLRVTLAPWTKAFWLPPCPLCWAARAFVLSGVISIYVQQ